MTLPRSNDLNKPSGSQTSDFSEATHALVNEVRRRCFKLLKAAAPTYRTSYGEFSVGVLSVYYDGKLRRGWRHRSAYSLEIDISGEGEALYEIQHPTEYEDDTFSWFTRRPERVNHNPELLAQALDILRKHMVLDDLAGV